VGAITSRRHRLWRWCARLAVVVGLVGATEEWSWQLSVAGAAAAGCVVVILGLPFTEGTFAAMRLLYGRGALGGAAVVAAAGLIAVGGFAGVLLVLMLVGCSPQLWDAVRSRWPTVLGGGPTEPADDTSVASPLAESLPAPADLRDLDDAELCLVWRHTFVALEAPLPVPHHVEVVLLREAILDELQRRCPAGFEAWLAAGARAPSNPLPYVAPLTSPRRRGQGPAARTDDPPPLGG